MRSPSWKYLSPNLLLLQFALLPAQAQPKLDGDPDLEINILATGIQEGMEIDIDRSGRVFIAERKGKVKLYTPGNPGTLTELIDLQSDTRSESGLIGIALDPDFEENQWVYLCHTVKDQDDPGKRMEHRLGRFVFADGKIDPASEKILLKIKADAIKRIHSAGSIAFDAEGLIYLAMGDNQIRSEYLYSCKTSANSNDLRGKILRIRPTPEGGYTIPEGNLFPPGTPKALPEIYIMGLRNPFRISVDKPTGWLLWGENGPPNAWAPGTKIPKTELPMGYDEFNIAKEAGFRGYPLIIANQQAFTNYDFEKQQALAKFDPDAPINDHKSNAGIQELPPSQPPLVWYQGSQPEFPELGPGGESAIAGPIYRMDPASPESSRLPAKYDGCWFVGEYSRGWVKAFKLDEDGGLEKIMPVLPALKLGKPTNLKIGPDGQLYVLYYSKNDKGHLVRLENPGVVPGSAPAKFLLSNDKPPRQLKGLKGIKLMSKSDCANCHNWQKPSIGPKFFDIAKRYQPDADAESKLAQKVVAGGTGLWGEIPMPPHPLLPPEEAKEMVKAILALNELEWKKAKK